MFRQSGVPAVYCNYYQYDVPAAAILTVFSVQSMVQGKKDIPNNQDSGYRRDSYASAGMNAAVAGTATIVNDTHKASAAEKVVTEQKRPSESLLYPEA